MLIDFHTHMFPDALAGRALGKLSDVCKLTPVTDATVEDTLEKLTQWGVDEAVALHIATAPAQQKNVNDFAAQINGGRLHSFGSVHFLSEDAPEEIERIHALGLSGVKLHPDYQGFDVNDRRLYPLYERIAALGLICVFHAGYDPLSPKHIHATPAMLAAVLREIPTLTVVCAHFGGMRLWDEVEKQLVGKRVYFDTAYTAGHLPREQAARIIAAHGAENILFGSDCPWQTSRETFEYFDSLPITQKEKDLIFYENARRLLG